MVARFCIFIAILLAAQICVAQQSSDTQQQGTSAQEPASATQQQSAPVQEPTTPAEAPAASAEQPTAPAQEPTHSQTASMQTEFHIRYIDGNDVYVTGGRDEGMAEGTQLIVKQDPMKPADDPTNTAIEPGIVAKLKVVSVASTSAVCEIEGKGRDLVVGDTVFFPDSEVEKIVEKNTLGNTRKYPMVISFSAGDPLDEEVRNAIPRPPLPEINQARGRLGFDMSNIQELGQGGSSSTEYGLVFRADITRIFGTHWNLLGYWRGEKQVSGSSSQTTIQDLINRTYLMSLTYINPDSRWTGGIGRLYLPWASSLETIDGGYLARNVTSGSLLGIFAGSTPDPTAWNYDPQRRIGGAFFNLHGGSFETFHYSATAGAGLAMQGWKTDRPFTFTENIFSYKRYFTLFEAMQVDRPTPNPSTPAVGVGVGESLVSFRVQVHPRVSLDLSDTYFRDVPTYDPTLVGTGLLNKYLYQGINGGARITFPMHVTGYFSLGQSNDSSDSKGSLNDLFGVTMANIWKTGLEAGVQYSKFNSAFASGNYRNISLIRDLGERVQLNAQVGKYSYSSSLAANDNSYFANVLSDVDLGSRFFVEGAFTTQRGGSTNYNQFTTVLGLRFDNRHSRLKKEAHGNLP